MRISRRDCLKGAGVNSGSLYASPYCENEGTSIGTTFTSGIVAADCMKAYIRGQFTPLQTARSGQHTRLIAP